MTAWLQHSGSFTKKEIRVKSKMFRASPIPRTRSNVLVVEWKWVSFSILAAASLISELMNPGLRPVTFCRNGFGPSKHRQFVLRAVNPKALPQRQGAGTRLYLQHDLGGSTSCTNESVVMYRFQCVPRYSISPRSKGVSISLISRQ